MSAEMASEVCDSQANSKPDQPRLNTNDSLMTKEEAKHLLSVMMRAKVLSVYL